MNENPHDPSGPESLAREQTARRDAERRLKEAERELASLRQAAAATRTRDAASCATLVDGLDRHLRSSLASILGYADLLCEPSLNESERLEFVSVVRSSGEKLLSLVDRTVEFARGSGAPTPAALALGPVDVPRLVEDAVARVEPDAAERQVNLEIHGSGPVPRIIMSDPTRLDSALAALLENAVGFTRDGSVSVTVGFEGGPDVDLSGDDDRGEMAPGGAHDGLASRGGSDPERSGCLVLSVADTGCGIDHADRERIFEPFIRGRATDSRRWTGPGLGLAVARLAARELGGDITIDGDDDGGGSSGRPGDATHTGATFVLRVPLTGIDADGWLRLDDTSSAEHRASRDSASGDPISGLRVLVSEQQPEIRWLIRRVLERAGAIVTEATDDDHALDVAASGAADLVVADRPPPGAVTPALSRRLRDAGFKAPILGTIVHATAEAEAAARQDGCDDVLCKPISPRRLVDSCVRWRGRTHVSSPDGRPARGAAGRPPRADGTHDDDPGGTGDDHAAGGGSD